MQEQPRSRRRHYQPRRFTRELVEACSGITPPGPETWAAVEKDLGLSTGDEVASKLSRLTQHRVLYPHDHDPDLVSHHTLLRTACPPDLIDETTEYGLKVLDLRGQISQTLADLSESPTPTDYQSGGSGLSLDFAILDDLEAGLRPRYQSR